jgi:hypothetical protein
MGATVDSTRKQAAMHSFGGRHAKIDRGKTGPQKDAHNKSYIPAPGKYDAPSGLGKQVDHRASGANMKFGTGQRAFSATSLAKPDNLANPSSAHYQTEKPLGDGGFFEQNPPAFSFGNSPLLDMGKMLAPG